MFVSFQPAAAADPRQVVRFCDTMPFAYLADSCAPPGPSRGEWPRLQDAHGLLRPGFMMLRAVRAHGRIVDFSWIFASTAAGRLLGRQSFELYGKRLLDVLAGHAGCQALYEQYSRVVLHGKAGATQQVHRIQGLCETIRHGAVRVDDGVAVTLINVTAARRADALSRGTALPQHDRPHGMG